MTLLQIILSLLLIGIILVQGKGGLLNQRWSGASFRSKRGVERTLFLFTILLAMLFLVSSIITLVKF